jgi:hypothetical protein
MFLALKVSAVILVAIAMTLALAHALEFPGKRQLRKSEYLAVQPIYYPGFTIGGASEPLALIMTLALTLVMPVGSTEFWLSFGAFLSLLLMHGTYWLVTHPVNNFWLKDAKLGGLGSGFFSFGLDKKVREGQQPDWTVLRDRWEYSHVLRAALALLGLVLVTTAVAL